MMVFADVESALLAFACGRLELPRSPLRINASARSPPRTLEAETTGVLGSRGEFSNLLFVKVF